MLSVTVTFYILLIFWASGQSNAQASFNLSSAACFNIHKTAQINLFLEWPAFQENAIDGACLDNDGTGYAKGQEYVSCGGCMKFICETRPCEDRDGSKFKMFWVLQSVDNSCCQDCSGKIIPPETEFSTLLLEGKCSVTQLSVCKTNTETGTGAIVEYFDSSNCCSDARGWVPSNTSVLEPSTCSERTCVTGTPTAVWERSTLYKGKCECCEYMGQLVPPDAVVKAEDGRALKCCEGEMREQMETSTGSQTSTTTTTLIKTTTSTTTTITKRSTATTTSQTTTQIRTTTPRGTTSIEPTILARRFLLSLTDTSKRVAYNNILGEYTRTSKMHKGFPVYKLEGSGHYLYRSRRGFWEVDTSVGGFGIIRSVQKKLEDPSTASWRYFENGRWSSAPNLELKADYSTPGWYSVSTPSVISRDLEGVQGIYEKTNTSYNQKPEFKLVGEDRVLYFSQSGRWMIGSDMNRKNSIVRSISNDETNPPLTGWEVLTEDGSWISDKEFRVESYNGHLHLGIIHQEVDLTEIWNDHGTHAVNDFSCWNPLPPNDEFVVLSNVPQYNYNKPPRGFVFHSSDAKAFADPVDFTFIWNDKGTEADQPTSFWSPVCPPDYTFVGSICNKNRLKPKPGQFSFKCVHKIYTQTCISEWTWNEENSGAPRQVSVFKTDDPFVMGMIAVGNRTETLENPLCLV